MQSGLLLARKLVSEAQAGRRRFGFGEGTPESSRCLLFKGELLSPLGEGLSGAPGGLETFPVGPAAEGLPRHNA